jgi:pyruvate dehydrogenase E2 component (dihydrolipoamide acetyltransferase)
MPTEVAMPRLGWDMQVGSVAEWLKRDGERIEVGEPICMIAADKGIVELEAPESGILHISPRSPEPGVEVPVGTLLAYLLEAGEEIPRQAEVEVARRIVASPRARRAAAGLGVDWRALVGSGRGGRILERDVARTASLGSTPPPRPLPEGEGVVPAPLQLGGIRRLTAERVTLSARTVAPVTLTTEANATTLVRLREQARAERDDVGGEAEGVPSVTDLLIKLVAVALGEHPSLNAELTHDGIVQHAEVNVGIAVDTAAGLIAPVVRSVGARSVESIARESARLINAARTQTSRPDDLTGATFTITNLGMYDIDAFTPIVNLPQCAILGLGRIISRPVVVDETTDQVAVRRMLTLSLTFDHRLVDGAPAARFLQRIKHLVERPTLWLFR